MQSHPQRASSSTPRATGINQRRATDQILETPRLLLIGATYPMLQADRAGHGLQELCGAAMPGNWPPEHWDDHALAFLSERMQRYPEIAGWCRYIALKREDNSLPLLIGTCGCTEPPATVDDVEIGYSILPDFHRRGYATEAIRGLLPWIFDFSNVQSICAQTYPHHAASLGVLRKCGFAHAGAGKEPDTILLRRMRG